MSQYDRRSQFRARYSQLTDIDTDYGQHVHTRDPYYDDYFYRRYMYGGDLPNYRAVVARHQDATNAVVGLERRYDAQGGSASTTYILRGWFGNPGEEALRTYSTSVFTTSGVWLVAPGPGEPDYMSDVIDQAKARFVAKVRHRMSPTMLGTTLGELRSTIHGIRHPAQALRDGLSSYLRSVKKQARGLKKAKTATKNRVVRDTWLEYSLGWRPLLYDIQNSAEALAAYGTQTRLVDTIRAGAHREAHTGGYFGAVGGGGEEAASYEVTFKSSTRAEYYGGISLASGTNVTLRSAFGLRPGDIVPTIWELIPYSFVADYFTNIGDIISTACFAMSDLAWKGGTSTCKNEAKVSNFQRTSHNVESELYSRQGSIQPGGSTATYRKIQRTGAPSLGITALHFRMPGSPSAYFNVAALFGQARAIRL